MVPVRALAVVSPDQLSNARAASQEDYRGVGFVRLELLPPIGGCNLETNAVWRCFGAPARQVNAESSPTQKLDIWASSVRISLTFSVLTMTLLLTMWQLSSKLRATQGRVCQARWLHST